MCVCVFVCVCVCVSVYVCVCVFVCVKSDCFSKLWGEYETHQCYFIFLGGGYETYISVVTELRGTKHIRFGGNRGVRNILKNHL